MKKLITICAVVGFILTTTNISLADDVFIPPWAGEERSVYAAWGDWIDFSGPMPPDWWGSSPEGLDDPLAFDVAGTPILLYEYAGRSNVIQLNQDNELYFSMPNFKGGECKEIWIQVTYYPIIQGQIPLFDVVADIVDMSKAVLVDSIDWEYGWVTEAWDFQIWPNPECEEIYLNFSTYPAYVDQVIIDTRCIPEPTTLFLLGIGSLVILRRRRV